MFTHSTPIPTDADLNVPHPAPAKLLHPGVPADKFYHLVMKEKMWQSSSGDTFGVKYLKDSGEKLAEGEVFEVDIKGAENTLRDRMIVQDSKDGTPVAVILGLFLKWESTYKIYTFTANTPCQAPSDKHKHEGRDLYEFATCKDKFMSVKKTMTTFDGVEYVMDGVGSVVGGYRQMRLARNGRACMHMMEKTLGIFAGNQWELKIAPGIDPVLVVAFMRVMDKMNETFMGVMDEMNETIWE